MRYVAEVAAQGNRRGGHALSTDNRLSVTFSMPSELGGDGGQGTNPEQLFAAGYAGCFHSALGVAARRQRVDIDTTTVVARVGVGPQEGGSWALDVTLEVSIPGVGGAVAKRLAVAAHETCPYSQAIDGNVPVEIIVTDDDGDRHAISSR